MKLLLKIIFILFAITLRAQPKTADRISITKAELAEKEKLSDFTTKIPKDCLILHYQVSCHIGGKMRLFQGKSDTLSTECKNAFKTIDPGSPLGIDIVYRHGSKQLEELLMYKIEKQGK